MLRPGRRAEIEPRRGQTVKLVALDIEWPPDQQADLPTPTKRNAGPDAT